MSDGNSTSYNLEVDHLTASIVSAYVSNNPVPVGDLPALIASVRAAISAPPAAVETGPDKATASEIKKSITPDALISFEDGKPYKTLRRHLTLRGLTPEAYRAKWGLSADYPMTSASYSAQRSDLARALGLGQQRRKSVANAGHVPAPPPPSKRRKAEPATAE